jgi:hypothetical protein
MKLNIRNPFRRGGTPDQAPAPEQPLEALTIRDIWEAPAQYNRATRRRAGLFGRFWRWDLNATEDTRRTYVPRYVRRHFDSDKFIHPKTRRQRRHNAVILRIMRSKGAA